MRRVLIATHGNMAEGVLGALKIITGGYAHVDFINGYLDGSNLSEQLDAYFAKFQPEQEFIVLTDLYGGSVNQTMTAYLTKHKIWLISGFNLALALEVAMMNPEETEDPAEELRETIERCKKQIRLINDVVAASKATTDDFDF